MRNALLLLTVLLVLCAGGCAPYVDVELERSAIRDAQDVGRLQAARAKDLERVLSFYADDATLLPPNAPARSGEEAIRALWSEWLANPGFAIVWQTTKVEVSSAGDLAYASGTREITLNDTKGNPATERGKFVAVWKKQPDGGWKVVTDIWNADQPLAAATPSPRAAPKRRASRPSPPGPGSRRARFAVQLGAYESRSSAEALARQVSTRYRLTASVAPTTVGGRTLYRVRIPLETEAEARTVAARIGAEQELKTLVIPLP